MDKKLRHTSNLGVEIMNSNRQDINVMLNLSIAVSSVCPILNVPLPKQPFLLEIK